MSTDLVVVDAFTPRPFAGNPAAVCLLERPADEGWMVRVAAEMNLSETAFLWPLVDGTRSLRWFTPTVEVELCGHATLASAHVLFTDGHAERDEVLRFTTRSGELTARRADDRITLDFPKHTWEDAPADRDAVAHALRIDPGSVVATARGHKNHVAELADTELVRTLQPDFAAIDALPLGTVLAMAAEPEEGNRPDVVSRYFAPRYGIDEDPVTGSTHSLIGPWFEHRLGAAFACYQASSRGGYLDLVVEPDRVRIRGQAVTTLRSTLVV